MFSVMVSVGRSWKNWKNHPEVAAAPQRQLVLAQPGQVGSGDLHAPGRRPVEPGDQVEQGGLAAAGLAEHGDIFSGVDAETDAGSAGKAWPPRKA